MKFIHTLFLLASSFSFLAASDCSELLSLLNHPETYQILQTHEITLDKHHEEGLKAILEDLANLHSKLQTRSMSEIEGMDRITVSGDWNVSCLVNLLTLIQNQGINRKMFNDAGVSSVKRMLDLVDPFVLPFTNFKRFLTSELVEKLIVDALTSNDPEESLSDAIDELAEKNGVDMDNEKDAEKLKKKMNHLMEMYKLSQQNKKLGKNDKWQQWSFDPGMSTLDDVLSMVSSVDHTLLSQALLRFGEVDPDENPVEDKGKGEGTVVQRYIAKGVADKPYPKSRTCDQQILDYEIEINNYGHMEDGKFVSDYITYDIILNCCKEDENISYESEYGEPISFIPGEQYAFLPAGIVGLGRSEGDNLFCIGASAQYYPNMPIGACGAQPAIGLQAKYGYQGSSSDGSSFSQSQFQLVPQALLLSPIIPNLRLISGLSFPISFGNQVSSFSGQEFKDNINSFGVSLTTGLSLELPNWNIQLQTDVASFVRTTTSSGSSPGSEFTDSDFGFWLNKSNPLSISVGKRIESF